MNGYLRKILCAFLALCLLLPSLPGTAAAETEPAVPETTEPTVPTTAAAAEPTVLAQEEESGSFAAPYYAWFGLLHAHTDLSDGLGSVEEAFLHASQVEKLDFFAVTDHSDAFGTDSSLTDDGAGLSAKWAEGKAAAAAVTTEDFLGLFGFEMSWPETMRLGHIATFGTSGWVSWEQEGFSVAATALKAYYDALTAVPGSVSQFCHPGEAYGDFDSFRHWKQSYDNQIQLLEVSSGEAGTAFDRYTAALDAGWHVAPTMNQNNHEGYWGDAEGARTVVLAGELTEEAIFDAIRSRRVYGTQDPDLHLYYTLNGYDMGETMPPMDAMEIHLTWFDSTDEALGTVEVVTEGGRVLAFCAPEGDFALPVAAGFRYYYLRITQPDGDIAVTAPVWVDLPDNVEILDLEADTQTPDQGAPVTLSLTLCNGTRQDITPEAVELYLGQTRVQALEEIRSVPAGGSESYVLRYTHPESGPVQLKALIRAGGDTFEKTVTLTWQPRETVTGLLIDGSHGNEDPLTGLKLLAAEAGLAVTTVTDRLPRGGEVLLIRQPETTLEGPFLADVKEFLESGGKLILCGAGAESLLTALGSGLALTEEPLPEGTAGTFATEEPWCRDIVQSQYFTHGQGRAVTGGRWLVKNGEQIVLAWEETPWGGGIFLSGCDFFADAALASPESLWQLPRANRTILQAILGKPEPRLPITDIGDLRKGEPGQQYRVRGYVTAGTSNEYNRFPNAICVQDDTGGILVTDFDVPGVQVGEPIDLIGALTREGENPALGHGLHRLPGGVFHYYDPDVAWCKTATDYETLGGRVVKVQGTVTKLTKTPDGKGICRLTLRDSRGGTAVVEIEEGIASGSTGKNTLAKDIKTGRVVRAIGLLHISEAGETVLRVRDCDEVVYVPPKADPTNPQTGDRFWWLW